MESSITTVFYDANTDQHQVSTPRLLDETREAWMARHNDDIDEAKIAFPPPAPPEPE